MTWVDSRCRLSTLRVFIDLSLRVFISNNLCSFNILYMRRLLRGICSRYFRYTHILRYSQAVCYAFIGGMITIIASSRSCTEILRLRFMTSLHVVFRFLARLQDHLSSCKDIDFPKAIFLLLHLLHRIQRVSHFL